MPLTVLKNFVRPGKGVQGDFFAAMNSFLRHNGAMKARTVWKDKLKFDGFAGQNPTSIALDGKPPFGDGSAPTPKEMVAIGLCGCTAMDVAALLKKYKQPIQTLDVSADIQLTEGIQPQVFKDILLQFTVQGQVDEEKLMEAIRLSQTKFCGVSAMLAKACPIRYEVILNGTNIGSGQSSFIGS